MKATTSYTRFSLPALALLVFSCMEDVKREPAFKDATPPSPVTEAVVTNTAGGAVIRYQVPKDPDLLQVEATFMRGNQKVIRTASAYVNKIEIEGLKSGQQVNVEIRAMDRSKNTSAPVTVTINPLKAPIDAMFDSFRLVETFGGVRLQYKNPEEIQVELQIFKQDEKDGLYKYRSSAFINNNKRDGFNFRGFEPKPGKFAAVAIDRWNNITDTLYADLTPIQEDLLDIQKFKKVAPAIPNDTKDAFGWVITNLWNDDKGGSGFHTGQTDPGVYIFPYTEPYHVFTMDLGVTANISRLRFWQRGGDWIYRHGNPRYFEVWGIDKIPPGYDGASLEGWTKLVENGEVIKPSGAPLGQYNADDEAAAAAGDEFETLDPTKPIRYIRFVNFQNWSGSKFMHIMEINFWGKKLE